MTLALADEAADVRPQSVHLIETMRCSPAGIVNRDAHMARLTNSAAILDFSCDRTYIEDQLDAWVSSGVDAVLRLLLHANGTSKIEARDVPANRGTPVVVDIADRPMPQNAWWTRHKTSYRAPYEDSRRRNPTVNDVILFNTHGHVTESTMANVAVRIDGTWVTPMLSTGCLPGTERAVRLEAGDLMEGTLTVADVRGAGELMLISSVRGLRRASLISKTPAH